MGHMQDYQAEIRDENGNVLDSLVVRGANLRLALENLCRMIATRDSGHGLKAVSVTVDKVGRRDA